jgi:hypothetical protein
MKVIKQKEWETLLSKENAIRINIKAKENDMSGDPQRFLQYFAILFE